MGRIAVIGAGWYGCHIGGVLIGLGLDVDIYEKAGDVFSGASGNNQFRLHMGFHYPRSHRTRLQSRDGFARFLERYPRLSAAIDNNFYAVPTGDSLLDFQTYKMIMSAAGIEFSERPTAEIVDRHRFQNLDGVLQCSERVILTGRAREYFKKRLGTRLHLNSPVERIVEGPNDVEVNGRKYDFVIDTTWGHLTLPSLSCFWEPTMLFYYRAKAAEPALTLVDGPLASVYPTEEAGLYTLSSVPITPIGQFDNAAAAVDARNRVDAEMVGQKRAAMEKQIGRYIKDFQDRFSYEGIQLAIKTKPIGASDDRSCWVGHAGRRFSVLSGKIDTIFFAAEAIVGQLDSMIEAMTAESESPATATVAGIHRLPHSV